MVKEEVPEQEEAEFDDWEDAIDVVADKIVKTNMQAADVHQPEEGPESFSDDEE